MAEQNNTPQSEKNKSDTGYSLRACLDKEEILRQALQEQLEIIAATSDLAHGCLSLSDGTGALYHMRRLWLAFQKLPETADEFKGVLAEKAHFEREGVK